MANSGDSAPRLLLLLVAALSLLHAAHLSLALLTVLRGGRTAPELTDDARVGGVPFFVDASSSEQ